MANDSLGRAVLELATSGDAKFFADVSKAGSGATDLQNKFDKTSKSVQSSASKMGSSLSQLNSIAGALGLSLSVGAVVNFGKEILAAGDQIVKTADRTGLMYEEVQRLQYISDQSGNSIEEMTGAIGALQDRLSSGDKSAVGAVKELGVNLTELRNASPYEQMAMLSDAFGNIPNPAKRAQLATDLFGKAGIAILPTLTSKFRDLGEAAPVMSDATVAALDRAGDALAQFQATAKVWAAEAYNYAGRLFDGMIAYTYKQIAAAYAGVAALATLAAKVPGASKLGIDATLVKSLQDKSMWYRDAASALEMHSTAAVANVKAVAPLPPLVDKLATAHKGAKKAVVELTAQQIQVNDLLDKARAHQAAQLAFEEAAWKSWESTVSKALQNIAKHPSLPLLQGRSLTGFVPQVAAGGAGNLAGVDTSAPAASQSMWKSLFGSPAEFGGQLSSTILGAIQGGGNPVAAASGMVGSKIGASIAGSLTKEGGKLFQTALGGIFSSTLPVVGSLIGPLVGKLWNSLFGTAGRDLVKEFAATFEGGFDGPNGLHAQLNKLGDEGERLWRQLTQGVGRNNPEQARAAIEAVTNALAAHEQKVIEDAAATQKAIDETAAKQQAAVDEAASVVKQLDDQIKSLEDSIAGEAVEEHMGIVEQQTRARIDALKKEREAASETLETLTEQMSDSMADVAEAIKDLPEEIAIRLRVHMEGSNTGTGGGREPIPMAKGGYGWARRPTLFLAGEAGPEQFAFSGANRSFGSGGIGLGERPLDITLMMPDGEVLLRQTVLAGRRVGALR